MSSDIDPLFRRLNRSGLAVLGTAEGARQAAGASEVHMGHLLAALFLASEGPIRDTILAAISEQEFFTILANTASGAVPDRSAYRSVAIDVIPPLSRHVADALAHVKGGAGFSWQAVDEKSLFVGTMAVTDCAPVAALLVRGVGAELGITGPTDLRRDAKVGGRVVTRRVGDEWAEEAEKTASIGDATETTRGFSPSPPGPPTIPDEPV